jgi:hypothetical protein
MLCHWVHTDVQEAEFILLTSDFPVKGGIYNHASFLVLISNYLAFCRG